MSRADLTKAPAEVAAMFDDVAERYDITNDVLALGRTRVWRRAVVDAVDPKPGQFILDLAAGTGTSSVPFARAGDVPNCSVTSYAFNEAQGKHGKLQLKLTNFVAPLEAAGTRITVQKDVPAAPKA